MLRCPFCNFSRSWFIRRNHRKCKRCRHEWSLNRSFVSNFRASEEQWHVTIEAFLRDRIGRLVVERVGFERHCVARMIRYIREVMYRDIPECFSDTVEADETYLGGVWRNVKRHVRVSVATKRGRGTVKPPIFGLFERSSGTVIVKLIPRVAPRIILPIITTKVISGSRLVTDGWEHYKRLSKLGYRHEWVDHEAGEYVRGDVHTQNLDGFWGYLKRRIKTTGGLRRKYLHLFIAEQVWRFNYRDLSREEQVKKVLERLKEPKFGGN